MCLHGNYMEKTLPKAFLKIHHFCNCYYYPVALCQQEVVRLVDVPTLPLSLVTCTCQPEAPVALEVGAAQGVTLMGRGG